MNLRKPTLLLWAVALGALLLFYLGCQNPLEETTTDSADPVICLDLGIDSIIILEEDKYRLFYKWDDARINPDNQQYLVQYTVFFDTTRTEVQEQRAANTLDNSLVIQVTAPAEEVPKCIEVALSILTKTEEGFDTLQLACGKDVVLYMEGVVEDEVILFRATDSTTVDTICQIIADSICPFIAFIDTTVIYEPPQGEDNEIIGIGNYETYNVYLLEDIKPCFCVDSILLDTTAFRQCMDTIKNIAFSVRAGDLPLEHFCEQINEEEQGIDDN